MLDSPSASPSLPNFFTYCSRQFLSPSPDRSLASSLACWTRHQPRPACRTSSHTARANFYLLHLIEALHHHLHVGLDHSLAQLAELLHILLERISISFT